MNQVAVEECPICWRSFSSTLVPVTIICGHSLCQDCSKDLRKCPLCRRRLQSGYTTVTNYSLLSLVNRMEQAGKRETRDQEIQTEKIKRQTLPRMKQNGVMSVSTTMAINAILKLTRVQHMLANTFKHNSNSLPN